MVPHKYLGNEEPWLGAHIHSNASTTIRPGRRAVRGRKVSLQFGRCSGSNSEITVTDGHKTVPDQVCHLGLSLQLWGSKKLPLALVSWSICHRIFDFLLFFFIPLHKCRYMYFVCISHASVHTARGFFVAFSYFVAILFLNEVPELQPWMEAEQKVIFIFN